MRYAAKWLGWVAVAAVVVPFVDIAEIPGFFKEPRDLMPAAMAQSAEARKAEADRLLDQGVEQYNVSQFREVIQSWEQALAIYREIGDPRGEGNTLGVLGVAYDSLGDYRQAIDFYEQSLAIAREIGDRAGEGRSLNNLGNAYDRLGDYRRAINLYEQSLVIARELGDRTSEGGTLWNLGNTYGSLGNAYVSRGDYQRAIAFYEQRLAITRGLGDRAGEGKTLSDIALVYYRLEDYPKALEFSQRSLSIFHEIGDRAREVLTLNNIGSSYDRLGDYPKALDFFQQELVRRREMGDRAGEGTTLNNIGIVYSNLGNYPKALEFYQQSLVILREMGDRLVEGTTLTGIGLTYSRLGNYPKALEFYQQALSVLHEIGDQTGEGTALTGIGGVYSNLGDYSTALEFFQQALAIFREIGDRGAEGTTFENFGQVYSTLGDYPKALDFYEQALVIFREIGNLSWEGTVLDSIGSVYSHLDDYPKALEFFQQALKASRAIGARSQEARSLGNIGAVYAGLGDYSKALEFFQQSLDIYRDIGARSGEGTTLNNIGTIYDRLGDYSKALEFFQQSLGIYRDIGARSGEGTTLNNIGFVLGRQDQPELAIVFLKASVDVRESIRGDIRSLDTSLQQSFTDTVAGSYRLLADLLLQADRVLEAQRVLDLLKVQELDDYLQGVQRNARTASGVDYLQPEQSILDQYNQLQASAIALGQERAQLSQRQSSGDLTPAETQRLQELVRLEQDLAIQFNSFAESPEIQALLATLSPQVLRQTVDLEGLSALRNNLDSLDAALIYPLILEDRLELVITTADTEPLRRTVAVERAELNAAILAFREALEDPRSDAQTPAQQLYRWLVEPLETDLAAAGVTTLLYAPDANLRYIPLAALHDGDQWLTERFRINHITALSLEELTTQPQAAPRILAGAFADVGTVHPVGSFTLQGLRYAGEEVSLLQAALPNTVALIDQAFDLETVLLKLGSANILHFATHGVFVPGDPEDSFILFGNGDAPTLREIGSWSLSHIDLVVLSACETGLGGIDNNGEQILGLGYQFQRRGAKAVIASLWAVSDQGTQILMTAFYDALGQGMTKAEALQAAQDALITGDSAAAGGQRAGIELISTQTGQPLVAGGSLAHPYYWAPFILIGNGL
jgi:CHAT domain-containing protein/Tfp pilus assembly protein PilF